MIFLGHHSCTQQDKAPREAPVSLEVEQNHATFMGMHSVQQGSGCFLYCAAPCCAVSADKTVFPKQDVVGWYCTGQQLEEQHMAVHRRVGLRGDLEWCHTTTCAGALLCSSGLPPFESGAQLCQSCSFLRCLGLRRSLADTTC